MQKTPKGKVFRISLSNDVFTELCRLANERDITYHKAARTVITEWAEKEIKYREDGEMMERHILNLASLHKPEG